MNQQNNPKPTSRKVIGNKNQFHRRSVSNSQKEGQLINMASQRRQFNPYDSNSYRGPVISQNQNLASQGQINMAYNKRQSSTKPMHRMNPIQKENPQLQSVQPTMSFDVIPNTTPNVTLNNQAPRQYKVVQAKQDVIRKVTATSGSQQFSVQPQRKIKRASNNQINQPCAPKRSSTRSSSRPHPQAQTIVYHNNAPIDAYQPQTNQMETLPAENMGVTFGGSRDQVVITDYEKSDNLISHMKKEDQNRLETLIRQQLIDKNRNQKGESQSLSSSPPIPHKFQLQHRSAERSRDYALKNPHSKPPSNQFLNKQESFANQRQQEALLSLQQLDHTKMKKQYALSAVGAIDQNHMHADSSQDLKIKVTDFDMEDIQNMNDKKRLLAINKQSQPEQKLVIMSGQTRVDGISQIQDNNRQSQNQFHQASQKVLIQPGADASLIEMSANSFQIGSLLNAKEAPSSRNTDINLTGQQINNPPDTDVYEQTLNAYHKDLNELHEIERTRQELNWRIREHQNILKSINTIKQSNNGPVLSQGGLNQSLTTEQQQNAQYFSMNNSMLKTLDDNYESTINGTIPDQSVEQIQSGFFQQQIAHGEQNLTGIQRQFQTLPGGSVIYEQPSAPTNIHQTMVQDGGIQGQFANQIYQVKGRAAGKHSKVSQQTTLSRDDPKQNQSSPLQAGRYRLQANANIQQSVNSQQPKYTVVASQNRSRMLAQGSLMNHERPMVNNNGQNTTYSRRSIGTNSTRRTSKGATQQNTGRITGHATSSVQYVNYNNSNSASMHTIDQLNSIDHVVTKAPAIVPGRAAQSNKRPAIASLQPQAQPIRSLSRGNRNKALVGGGNSNRRGSSMRPGIGTNSGASGTQNSQNSNTKRSFSNSNRVRQQFQYQQNSIQQQQQPYNQSGIVQQQSFQGQNQQLRYTSQGKNSNKTSGNQLQKMPFSEAQYNSQAQGRQQSNVKPGRMEHSPLKPSLVAQLHASLRNPGELGTHGWNENKNRTQVENLRSLQAPNLNTSQYTTMNNREDSQLMLSPTINAQNHHFKAGADSSLTMQTVNTKEEDSVGRVSGLVAKKRALIRATQDIPPQQNLSSQGGTIDSNEEPKPIVKIADKNPLTQSKYSLREQFNDDQDELQDYNDDVETKDLTQKVKAMGLNQNLRYSQGAKPSNLPKAPFIKSRDIPIIQLADDDQLDLDLSDDVLLDPEDEKLTKTEIIQQKQAEDNQKRAMQLLNEDNPFAQDESEQFKQPQQMQVHTEVSLKTSAFGRKKSSVLPSQPIQQPNINTLGRISYNRRSAGMDAQMIMLNNQTTFGQVIHEEEPSAEQDERSTTKNSAKDNKNEPSLSGESPKPFHINSDSSDYGQQKQSQRTVPSLKLKSQTRYSQRIEAFDIEEEIIPEPVICTNSQRKFESSVPASESGVLCESVNNNDNALESFPAIMHTSRDNTGRGLSLSQKQNKKKQQAQRHSDDEIEVRRGLESENMRSDMGDNPELLRQSTHSLLKCKGEDESIDENISTPGYQGRQKNIKTNNFVDSDDEKSLAREEPSACSAQLSDSNKMMEDSCENMF